jgi:N-methylhydantoinase A
MRLAVDIGGTFTDVAVFDPASERLTFGKALSTQPALVEGIADGVSKAGVAFAEPSLFLHGSTIAINTLIERSGARAALLITRGFRDIYEIGRVNRPDAYNLFFGKHVPLIERAHRFEVDERLNADGSVHEALDEAQVISLADKLRVLGIESVAILLLHSYRNPMHEMRVKELLTEQLPGVFITASYELSREYREFERVSTVAANAYIGPRVRGYVEEIEAHIQRERFEGSFLIVQSTGGLFPSAQATRECVRMLESGPAAGVIGAQAIAEAGDLGNVIAFDMGGTTAKAGVILDGVPMTTGSALIGGYERALPIQIAMMDIFEVGTGGGSIARLNEGNALRVGPQSAGSHPGPACYGLGGRDATVTDANLILGRLDPERFLGGEMALDPAAARRAVDDTIGRPLGLSTTEAAAGILLIAATAMSYAVRAVTTERGLDAGSFTLVVYGGAGPLHASMIAREIGIKRVVIPLSPGHFSAYGMLYSDLRYDYVRTCFIRLADVAFDELETYYQEMEVAGTTAVREANQQTVRIVITRSADIRYVGQEHAVTVDLPADLFAAADAEAVKRRFDTVHELRYGTSAPNERAELVNLRVTVLGVMEKPAMTAAPGRGSAEGPPRHDARNVYFGAADGFVRTAVYAREDLRAGDRIEGPALIQEYASTTVVHPGDVLNVDVFGHLSMSIGGLRS